MTAEELEKLVSRITLGTTFSRQLPFRLQVWKPSPLGKNTWIYVDMMVEHRRWHGEADEHLIRTEPIGNFDVLTEEVLAKATPTTVVRGVFNLIRRTLEHELRENFYFDGARVYDPHEKGLAEEEESKARAEARLLYGGG